MSTLSVSLPESLHKKLEEIADREGISIDRLISSAAAEKVAALLTTDYLAESAARGSRQAYESVLAKVPDVPADPRDQIEQLA